MQWTSAGIDKTFEANGSEKNEKYLISWNESTEAGSITNEMTQQQWRWDIKANNHRNITCQ